MEIIFGTSCNVIKNFLNFKKHPTFVPSTFQSGDIAKIPLKCVFLGHPVLTRLNLKFVFLDPEDL